ncbi:HDL502Cp [Eremothecium sinecaudum]|uniref:Mannan endo-1,6-alpha-mannosidase n=1 Tax=Eremothecium sinecaudum TaxID=45286 RepID=A0A0X8HRP4_9SACH|nr:HDL502Cp [Eremothecium sinecaudum]AMD20242.1 HDL502Cp [Eremothecium sinecaudum]
MMLISLALRWALLLFVHLCGAINLDTSSKDSICAAADIIQTDIMNYYPGKEKGGDVGVFAPPYYWWEAGLVFGGMLENWYLCDNTKYQQILHDSLVAQSGSKHDFMPEERVWELGNDDQGVWGLFVIDAVERNFPDSTEPGVPGWLAMAQAVYNTMLARWDTEHCGGGLRWQIFAYNTGYDYKNTISNGCLFHIAARLARYTGEQEYLDTAERVFQWLMDVKFIEFQNPTNIMDGSNIRSNCTDIKGPQWSYNHGIILAGCAYMYSVTNSDVWRDRITQILESVKYYFFRDNIMYESACQGTSRGCNNDQRAFKSLLSRMMAATSILAPFTNDDISTMLRTSAAAAAASCSGGSSGSSCGQDWSRGYDGLFGLGEQISALDVIQSLLIHTKPGPNTASQGGSSKGDPNAGKDQGTNELQLSPTVDVKSKDRAGAAILTAIVLSLMLATALWMMF